MCRFVQTGYNAAAFNSKFDQPSVIQGLTAASDSWILFSALGPFDPLLSLPMDLDQFIDRAKQLPPPPTLLPELLSFLNKSDIDTERVIRLITHDPTLTANVLRLSNSAALGSFKPIASLNEAVLRLGFEQILRLVVASCGAQVIRSKGMKEETVQRQLWSHSVVSAISAQTIAKMRDLDQNLAFTAALLHDIGKTVMWDVLGEKYASLLEEVQQNHYALLDTEKRVLGLDHAELGGRLLARWKLPLNLVAAVCFHYNPPAATPHQTLAACVYFGNFVANELGYSCHRSTPAPGRAYVFEQLLKLKPGEEAQQMSAIQEDFAAVQALIDL
jgi:putative nucleotidyltransferase with HDIG domain